MKDSRAHDERQPRADPPSFDSDPELALARDLVMAHGWNATSYQIVNPGIERWFNSRKDAIIGYVRKHGVRVVAGAPICAIDHLDDVLAEWDEDAARARDSICYFGAAGRVECALRLRSGYSTVVLGAQPVWQPGHWHDLVVSDSSLRAQLNRARNKGVRIEQWDAERATNSEELRSCLSEWLQTRGLPPLHFLVEPETLAHLEDRKVFVAIRDGQVVGFTVLSPVPKRNGWLTEQFPRGFRAPNGTVELLLDTAARAVADEQSDYLTMGLVPLSSKAAQVEETPLWLRGLLGWVRAHGRRFYNFDGLEWFKTKFHPESWEPIYAIAKESRFSARTLYAVAEAFSDGPPLAAVGKGLAKAIGQEGRWLTDRYSFSRRGHRTAAERHRERTPQPQSAPREFRAENKSR